MMRAIDTKTPEFRWRSWLGACVAVFLLYGAFNAFAAIYVPLSLHFGGPAATGGLVMTDALDGALLGRTLDTIGRTDPRLATYLVTFMDTMCAQMMAFAIVELAVVWYALRRARRWALWAALLGGVAIAPYYVAILLTYARAGVELAPSSVAAILSFTAIPIGATVLGRLGLRQAHAGRQIDVTARQA
jgi:hypothetical protein